MFPILFVLFLTVPVIEIAVFIQVGGFIGLWPTLAIVILTAIAGTSLLRAQGLKVAQDAQAAIEAGNLPMEPVLHGVFLLAAGLLLLTPGFVTDAVGFLLFVPAIRLWLGRKAAHYLITHGSVTVLRTDETGHWQAERYDPRDVVVDVAGEEIEPEPGQPDPTSPWADGEAAPDPRLNRPSNDDSGSRD